MKKKLYVLTVITTLFTLTACSSANTKTNKMYIESAKLTEDEKALIELVGVEEIPYIVDFSVDDTIQSLQINTYELENNEWKLISGGGGRQFTDTHGRMALIFDNIGCGLQTALENYGYNRYGTISNSNFEGMGEYTSFLSSKTAIEYEKEIPLVIQIYTSKDTIQSLSPEFAFYEPQTYEDLGYEKVYAITCLFSQKSVKELSAASEK